jgi:glutathione peroxidase
MINLKKLFYIIIFMISFFNTGNAKYDKIFFDFDIKDINEETFALKKLKDKTVLLVNVASNCGFTKQYAELQELYEKYRKKDWLF